ncbi:MAG: hypothetical protein ACYCV4_17150 [Dermatophilaceae bacterium]
MRTKQKAAVLVEQRLARDRTEAYYDARALAIELARAEPSSRFDPLAAGVVLKSGETVYRQVPMWVRVQQDGRWADASYAKVLVTDRRLLCRFTTGRLASLWWRGIVGLHVDLAAEHVVLDYGDGQPVGLSGAQAAPVSVAVIASIYGAQALVGHSALAPLRTGPRQDPR